MAVYVDNMRARYKGMIMCHMVADSTEELLQMVDKIGVDRKWIQSSGHRREHFDVCAKMRVRAVGFGAIEVTKQEIVKITLNR